MEMSGLPRDLLENILSRISYKSLRNIRRTCKQWNALFKDRESFKDRFHKAAREVIVMMNSEVYSLTLDFDGDNNCTMINTRSLCRKHHYLESNQVSIADMFHCDGLLLFRTTTYNKLMVWNTCLGQTRFVFPPNTHTSCIFALGYNNKLRDSYKILSICIRGQRESSEFDIYEFNSHSWRALDNITLNCIIQSRGVSSKGNTYWIASDNNDPLLLCFDFTTERFGRLNLPPQRHGYETLGLSVVRKEDLSVLHQSCDTSKVEIWVMTNDRTDQTKVLSWTKLLAVDLNTYYNVHKFTCDVSFFFDEENKVAVCWDEGNIYVFGEDHDYSYNDFYAYEYKPYIRATMCQGWFKFNLKARDHEWYDLTPVPKSKRRRNS